jgi:hypothetical protein
VLILGVEPSTLMVGHSGGVDGVSEVHGLLLQLRVDKYVVNASGVPWWVLGLRWSRFTGGEEPD